MAIFSLDWWWLLCQTDLGEDGLTKTWHRPLANVNALLVNTEMCKETGHGFSLQKKKSELFWADCTNLPISFGRKGPTNGVVQMSRIGRK